MTIKLTKTTITACIEQANIHMALADEQRQKLLHVLDKNGEMNVNSLAEQFELTRSAVTHHIKIMFNAKLLLRKKNGKEVFYKLNKVTLLKLSQSLQNLASQN